MDGPESAGGPAGDSSGPPAPWSAAGYVLLVATYITMFAVMVTA